MVWRWFYAINFPICTVGSYVSLCSMIFLCPFLHCKALRTAMYKRYINSIIIIITVMVLTSTMKMTVMMTMMLMITMVLKMSIRMVI